MKIGAILQARTSSTRLPCKVLKELPYGSGIASLQQIIRRLKKAQKINDVIVATTEESSDDPIVDIARKENVKCFRGSLNDVLSRYYGAAKEANLDIVIRITGDCPCIDPRIIDMVIEKHLKEKGDYTSNVGKRSYADGLDVEVFNFEVLERVFHTAQRIDEREHVTAYIHNHPDQFKMVNIEAQGKFFCPKRRITLDTVQDYAVICAVYDALYEANPYFDAEAIMDLFEKKPWLDWINS